MFTSISINHYNKKFVERCTDKNILQVTITKLQLKVHSQKSYIFKTVYKFREFIELVFLSFFYCIGSFTFGEKDQKV